MKPSSSLWSVRTCLPDLEQSKYWLIRVVKNLSLNHEKRKNREKAAYAKLTRLTPVRCRIEREAADEGRDADGRAERPGCPALQPEGARWSFASTGT